MRASIWTKGFGSLYILFLFSALASAQQKTMPPPTQDLYLVGICVIQQELNGVRAYWP